MCAAITTLTNAENTFTGGANIVGSMLQVASDAMLGPVPASPATNITLNNGQLYNNGGQLTLNVNRNVSIVNTVYIEPGWGPTAGITVNGQISRFEASLAVAWDGGALLLNGSNSYQGNTTIGSASGVFYWQNAVAMPTLRLGNANALPTTTNVNPFGRARLRSQHRDPRSIRQ